MARIIRTYVPNFNGVRVIYDRETKKSRGFGFVVVPNYDSMNYLIGELNGKPILGRPCIANEARQRGDNDPEPSDLERYDEEELLAESIVFSKFFSELAKIISGNIHFLNMLNWLQMEEVVAEVFDGLGFDVELTPSSKDGGKDCIVSCVILGVRKVYYIEVKHWKSGKRSGQRQITDFVRVIVKDGPAGGLFLSTSGFTNSAFEGTYSVERTSLAAGDGTYIHQLCKKYVRMRNGLWNSDNLEKDVILHNSLLH